MGIFHWLESKCQLGGFYMTLLVHFYHHFFLIKGSCFQNVQGLSLFKVNFLSLRKKYSGAFIILSEASHASLYHFTCCNLFVSNQTSVCHFSLIYFFINLTFVMCNRPQASCSCSKPMNYFVIKLWLQECHFQWHVTSVQGHILVWKHVGLNSKKLFQKVGSVGERSVYTLA